MSSLHSKSPEEGYLSMVLGKEAQQAAMLQLGQACLQVGSQSSSSWQVR
jgi:hypothetical protein